MDTGINHHDIARHHVVRIRKYYSVLVFAQLVLAATTLGLMLPYTGPEADWPGLYRFLTFVVNAFPASGFLSQFAKTDLDECMSTFVICTYYLVGTHLFPPLYCCWAWLVCCVWQLMVWVSVWVDITYNAGRISQQLNIKGDNYWLTDNEYAETVWMRRVAMRYYTAAVVSGIHAYVSHALIILFTAD
jgi:hypothetical protein